MLDGRPAVLKGTSVGVEESVSLVLVKVAGETISRCRQVGSGGRKNTHEVNPMWKMATALIRSSSTLRGSV